MSSTVDLPATAGSVVLTGTPVVPGVAVGPVVRPSGSVRLPASDAPPIDQAGRPAEKERYRTAAETVAQRLGNRAAVR
jgi:phosphotransferase system enzyme I (PtsI)